MKYPSYIRAYKDGTLLQKINEVEKIVESCTLCPHACKINRRKEISGYCNSSIFPVISSFSPHMGEEPPITGYKGSGTIFFTHCNLNCIFCQNCDISQLGKGQEISYDELSDIMIQLQQLGCHNINFVSPTHMILPIVKSLPRAIENGLRIPLVYNSGGYDSLRTLEITEGLFDIYLPDFKFMDEKLSFSLSNARFYPKYAGMAIREMYRQVGILETDNYGIAEKGLLIRHLVLPGYVNNSKKVIEYLSGISVKLHINIMDQYHPEYRSSENANLVRRITKEEISEIIEFAQSLGMENINKFE